MGDTGNTDIKPQTPAVDPKLYQQAEEFLKSGKGRPPNVIAPIVKEITRKKRAALKKVAGEEDTTKLEAFVVEFIKNGGNATQAALTVTPTISVVSASQTASRYVKRAKELGLFQIYLEKKGYGLGKFMDKLIEKIETSDRPDWWDRGMKMTGYEDFMTKNVKGGPQVVNIVGTHKKDVDEFGFAEEGEIVDESE